MRSTHAPKACITGEAFITHAVRITFRKERITQKSPFCPDGQKGLFCWPARRDSLLGLSKAPPGLSPKLFAPVGRRVWRSFRIPPNEKESIACRQHSLFLARPEGFEPPAFGIGIHCDIQLRHGRILTKHIIPCCISICKTFFRDILGNFTKKAVKTLTNTKDVIK